MISGALSMPEKLGLPTGVVKREIEISSISNLSKDSAATSHITGYTK